MKSRAHRITPLLLLLSALIALLAARNAGAGAWRAAVDPAVLAAYQEAEEVEFIVLLTERTDLSMAREQSSKLAKGRFTYRALRETASASQADLLAELSNAGLSSGVTYRPFWIVNAVWVKADADILRQLAQRQDVKYIYGNPRLPFDAPVTQDPGLNPDATETVEWNLSLIGAPELWQRAIDGRGVVIGGQDTGYDWRHDALINQYRGWDGQSENHDYNWHDAIHSSDGVCGADSDEPCDDHGHGTHTMGTMVGDDGGSNKIGVAPAARWIGCRNMDRGVGTPATYIECFEWFIAPTKIDGSDPEPSMAPDIINNSWSCPPDEGCNDPGILQDAVDAVRAAGILTVQSAGNRGPGCATIDTPAAIYDASLTVGATTSSDHIASYSSRGPVLIDGSGRQKPDVVAPGSAIRSSYLNGGYNTLSGTSMAAPHVAGLAALLISAVPNLAGQVDRLESLILDSAVHKTSSQTCFHLPGDQVPNAVFGHGRIDAVAALRLTLPHKIILLMIHHNSPIGSTDAMYTR
ncbi:MAG: S8 family serine peptidase [Chloroflexota bacterium]|nr:MAG: S8 family serine peptidase [Chloroflexota bacterium]